jgi:hypothetical protein
MKKNTLLIFIYSVCFAFAAVASDGESEGEVPPARKKAKEASPLDNIREYLTSIKPFIKGPYVLHKIGNGEMEPAEFVGLDCAQLTKELEMEQRIGNGDHADCIDDLEKMGVFSVSRDPIVLSLMEGQEDNMKEYFKKYCKYRAEQAAKTAEVNARLAAAGDDW